MTRACNAAMPRTKLRQRRAAYWWSEEIAALRRGAIRAGRRVARCRGDAKEEAREGLRAARRSLRVAIKAAKAKAWKELLLTVDRDPWGRPYKMVLNKLRPWAPPATETLDPGFLRGVVENLFPAWDGETAPGEPPGESADWSADLEVGAEELLSAVGRSFKGNTAPGPDGVHKRAWALAWRILVEQLRQQINGCLKLGIFPPAWRRASLVLLRKEGRKADDPSAFRPICLLDEAGKLFERVVANRLVQHLSRVGPGISGAQFGFREGTSTVDAINHVRALSDEATSQGRVMLAVSLDISNAFNTLPWVVIGRALESGGVPLYLRRVVRDYLRDRWVEYTDRGGSSCQTELHRGVPQGSVLGPLLWNVGYDAVLRSPLPLGCHVVGYADDTLVLAEGESWGEAVRRGEMAVSRVISSIRGLGLAVAEAKTEAVLFHDRKASGPPPPDMSLAVGAARVKIGPSIKYLGLILDGSWTFKGHIEQAARRARERATTLGRILPNLGGPNRTSRKLYAGTVRAVALYGAPVFADRLTADRRSREAMRSALQPMALRIARAYRTVSRAAAELLAEAPPAELLASEYARCYRDVRALRAQGVKVTERLRAFVKVRQRQTTLQRWKEGLASPETPGRRTVDAILPVFDRWLGRAWGGLSFRTTQVLSGHGCFGHYLCRIGREQTRDCHHCSSEDDTAQHTLEDCPAWADQRAVLVRAIGPDLSLPGVIAAILAEERSWHAFASFCEHVMSQKEAAERERRGEEPRRQGEAAGGGRGRRRRQPPPPRPPSGGGPSAATPPSSLPPPPPPLVAAPSPPSPAGRVLRPRVS